MNTQSESKQSHQQNGKKDQSKNKLVIAILILALALRFLIAWQPVPILTEKILLDDSFYGWNVARNIAWGNGITYNSVDVTNGIQPLWVFSIVPIFLFTNDIYLAVNLILSFLAVLDIMVVFLIYKLAKDMFSEKVGLLAAFLWAVNPFIMFQTLQGIDVTIYILLVLATLIFYNRIKDEITKKNSILLGLLLGLAFLARGDGLFLFIVIAMHIFWNHYHHVIFSAISKRFFLTALVMLLVVSPWFLWSYFTFGTITQSSQIGKYLLAHGDMYRPEGPIVTFDETVKVIGENFVRSAGALVHQFGVTDFYVSIGTIILIPFFILIFYGFVKSWRRMSIPIAFSIMLILFYAGYIWAVQIRYIIPVVLFLTIFLAAGMAEVIKSKKILIPILMVLVAIWLFYGLKQWDNGYFLWQRFMYENIMWLNQYIPKDAIIGSYGAGINMYFSNNRVINLDGLVQYDAIDANLNRQMYAYMYSKNISYWIDVSIHNESVDELRREGKWGILEGNEYRIVFEPDSDIELVRNNCELFTHIRGFKMLMCFFIMKTDYNNEWDYETIQVHLKENGTLP